MQEITIKAVFFDLDGTFADTAPDLADALNKTLVAHHKQPLQLEQIRPVVSHGGKALIELGFGIPDSDPEFEDLRQELLAYYQQDLATHTQLFTGITECLVELDAQQIKWGIVTNKPGWLTEPLMSSLQLPSRPCSVVSGDTLQEKKPHPAPLLHACQQCQVEPANAMYIGDAQRDIEAGRRAGMFTVIASYGYIGQNDDTCNWQADAAIDRPQSLLPLLTSLQNRSEPTDRYAG